MKILSFNCRGLACPLKRQTFERLVESSLLDIIFIQETMGKGELISPCLEILLKGWSFSAMDV